MHRKLCTLICAVALTVCAAPAFADGVSCTVTAEGIRLRKGPSNGARVIAVLKKQARLHAADTCSGGWVQVASADGRLTGYVGGWAIAADSVDPAATFAPPGSVPAVQNAPVPRLQPGAVPGNEQLALRITELRLHMLGVDREIEALKKEIRQVRTQVARRSRPKVSTAGVRKGRREAAKKG